MIARDPVGKTPKAITWEQALQEIAKCVSFRRYLEIMLAVALDDKTRKEFLLELNSSKARQN